MSREQRSDDERYRPEVRFEYTFEGEHYESDRLYPETRSHTHSSRSAAQSTTSQYEVGTSVTAFVDPAHPDEAFLNDERTASAGFYYIVAAVFALGGVVFVGVASVAYWIRGHVTEDRSH